MTEIAFRSATELARMIRAAKITSCELLEIYLARIERSKATLNAVVTLDIEGARQQARQLDEESAKGQFRGPLHGLPVTIKDGFETAGMRTTSGAPPFKKHIPQAHAAAVQRYVDAGAVIVGKTNVPIFCADFQSYNELFGTTNNPWDPERTPGGSSGGAAASLAAGLCALELGSDIAGSIRIPASWSGVYGHRPSYGIVPFRGHIPPPPHILSQADLAMAGPMGRSAEDLKMALALLAGPDTVAATAWQLNLPVPRANALQEYRVAVWLEDAAIPLDNAVHKCLADAIDKLRAVGVKPDENARPKIGVEQAFKTYQQLLHPVMASGYPTELYEMLSQMAQNKQDDSELAQFARQSTADHRDWLSANAKREFHRRSWAQFFQEYDVLLCPVTSLPAIEHNHEGTTMDRTIRVNGNEHGYFTLAKWAGIFTHVHLPVTVAPVGQTPNGLPVGIQIVGPYLEDYTPIDFAQKISEVVGGFQPPPGY